MLEHKRNEGQSKDVLSSLEIASILEGHLDSGYSVDRFGDSPHKGYAVGLVCTEARFNFKPNGTLIADWVADQKLKREKHELGHQWVYGVWFDKGYYYLDVSLVIEDREKALYIGGHAKQLAIYDCAAQEEIRLDGESAETCPECGVFREAGSTFGCKACEQYAVDGSDDEPETDEQRREALEIDLLVEKSREHVSGDSRVSVAERLRRPGNLPCKGCAYDGAERPGKCSVCPVTP